MRTFAALAFAVVIAGVAAAPANAQRVDAAERRDVILRAADLIETRYVDPAMGRRVAAALRADAQNRSYPQRQALAFADALTERLRALSRDGHFAVEYRSPAPGSTADGGAAEMERWYGAGVNHGFEAVRRLEGGVAYLDLRVFAPTAMAGDLAEGAMSLLASSPALIIDLRNNGGGVGEMAAMLQAYLLDGSVEISGVYDRPTDRLTRAFTPGWVPGRRFGADKPVYVLISRRTFSAAEAFAYDLQAMGRAVIVGERSGGGSASVRIPPDQSPLRAFVA